ncbi:multiple ankyrin repeats single kh domain protein [Rutstroemia sp. NJR-2017a BBW]|nr:multiple ankyrin repeats single kh domain protein [Rutstroemia sp. NJR-2017a BBW]
MGLAWETHRDLLKELWIAQDKTYDEVRMDMKRLHNFNATKNQYTAQFKKWGWRKNITSDEWRLISRSIIQRREDHSKESEVYLNNVRIPDARIRKDISRHVLPTFNSIPTSLVTTTLDSQHISIRTPPPMTPLDLPVVLENQPRTASSMVQMKRKLSTQHEIDLLPSKQLCKSDSPILQEKFVNSSLFLSKLPSNVSLACSDAVEQYDWSLDVDANNLWAESSVEPSANHGSIGHFYDSFAHFLVPRNPITESQDQLRANKAIREQLPNILANIPERYPGERESTIETLLGPPQFSAALRLLEVVVYLYSNGYLGSWRENAILQWILDVVPFPSLIIILRTKLPTLQPFQNALLIHGIRTGNTLFIKNLLQPDTGLQDWIRLSSIPLREAVRVGNFEMVKIILDICPGTASHYRNMPGEFVESGLSAQIAQLLVGAGVDIFCTEYAHTWGDKRPNLLVIAISRGDIALAQYLISIGADVNLGYEKGDAKYYLATPLRIAVNTDRIDLVRLLSENHADVHAVSESGYYEYCPYRQIDPITCKPKAYKDFTATALQAAASNGNIDIVDCLLKAGSYVNEPAHGNDGQTAIYAATNAGNLSVAKLLVQSGANINAPGCPSTTFPRPALLIAIENNDYTLAEFLMDSGAGPNAPAFGYHGTTVLEAARNSNGNDRIVSFLLAKGAEDRIGLNDPARNSFMRFQLLQAIRKGDSKRVHFLIERGAEADMETMVYEDVHQVENRSNPHDCHWHRKPTTQITMLHLAIAVKKVDLSLFKHLLKHTKKGELDRLDYTGSLQPLLSYAVRLQRVEFVEALLDAGADINTILPHKETGRSLFLLSEPGPTALYTASILGDVDIVSVLLDRGADINLRLPDTSTALQVSLQSSHALISEAHFDVFELLLSRGADINAPPATSRGYTALQTAIKTLGFIGAKNFSAHIIGLVKRLLSLGARVNDPPAGKWGQTALQAASEAGNLDVVLLLLDHGAEINAPAAEQFGKTAIQCAAAFGHVKIVQLLIERGADVNAYTTPTSGTHSFTFSTALENAAAEGHIKVVQLLLENGAEVNSPNIGSPALDVAAMRGRLDMAQILINAGADHNLPMEERYVSALEQARKHARTGLILLLEKYRSRLVPSR